MAAKHPNIYIALKIVPDQDDLEDTKAEVLGVFKSKLSADRALFKEHESMKKQWLKVNGDTWPFDSDELFGELLAEKAIKLIVVRKMLKP